MTKIVTVDKGGQTAPERGRLRERMPLVTAFIDAMRREFGAEWIDSCIAAGMRGEPDCFHAIEAGLEIGTPFTPRPT